MRFLFSVRPYIGHLHPMLPLARSLTAAGHEVLFATAAEFTASVRAAGFQCEPAGHDPRLPISEPVPAADRGPYGLWATRRKTDHLLTLCAAWPPDVIVREPTDFAGLLAGEILGLPHAVLGFSLFYPRATWQELAGRALAEVRAEYGLAPDPDLKRLHPYLYLDTVPPWFQGQHPELPPTLVAIQPEPIALAGELPLAAWFGQDAARPLVYATLGTFYNRHPRFFSVVAEALSEEAVNVVCTVGEDQSPAEVLPTPPANVHLAAYLNQATVLRRASAVISHGGFSTVIGALCAGVPVVTVPHGADHPGNAERARQLGTGIVVALDRLAPAEIRDAVMTIVNTPRFRAAAASFRAAVSSLPSVDDGARLLAELAQRSSLGVPNGFSRNLV